MLFCLEKNACLDVEKSSLKTIPPQTTQSPIATSPPSLKQQKPDIGVKSSLPSQSATAEGFKDLQDKLDKLSGIWVYLSACELDGESAINNKVMVFHKNRTITEIVALSLTVTKPTLFSTKITKIRANIKVTYEWSIEEALLHMKIVDRAVSVPDALVNGKPVKVNDRNATRLKNRLERSLLKGETIKYKILGIEEDSIILEKIGGKRPVCENNFIVKYVRAR